MQQSIVAVGLAAWLIGAALVYVFLRRAIVNIFDPLAITNLAIPFSASLLAVLCSLGLVSGDKLSLFAAVLIGYLLGGRVSIEFFERGRFRAAATDALSSISAGQIWAIVTTTVAITGLMAALGLQDDATGDARQAFARALRPLLLVQNGLYLISLILLLSSGIRAARSWIAVMLLVLLSIPFSGKGVIMPAIYWLGLRLFLTGGRPRLRVVAAVVFAAITAGAGMTILAYGSSGWAQGLLAMTNRLWMSGDVYIYAYQRGALDAVRDVYPVSFVAYLMHPVTSLVGIRAYDRPLGAMLASEVAGREVLTGPNPQLPVLLDYFFPGNVGVGFTIAAVIGCIVMSIRSIGLAIARGSRSRYFRVGGIAAAVFAPAAGFLDFSLVLIALIAIAAATAVLVGIQLITDSRRADHSRIESRGPHAVGATGLQ